MNNHIVHKAIEIWISQDASRENIGHSVNGNINAENYLTEVVWNNGIDEKGYGIPMEAPISWSDLQSFITQAEDYFASTAYETVRRKEYPKIQEQLDMQYWDKVNGTTNWQDAIAKVKSDNPKS